MNLRGEVQDDVSTGGHEETDGMVSLSVDARVDESGMGGTVPDIHECHIRLIGLCSSGEVVPAVEVADAFSSGHGITIAAIEAANRGSTP